MSASSVQQKTFNKIDGTTGGEERQMPQDEISREVIEKMRVQSLVSKSIIARDSGHWERVAECYHPQATLATSWFTGTPAEFVAGSRTMKIARHPGESQKHMTSNFWVELNGARAVSECDLILHQRRLIEGIELDFTTWSRRLDFVELVGKDWKIWRATFIYEKDRMDPASPGENLQQFYSSIDLSPYPPEIRHHCWRNAMVGFPPAPNICVKDSAREVEVRAEAERWLKG
jgi:hypothetical protein